VITADPDQAPDFAATLDRQADWLLQLGYHAHAERLSREAAMLREFRATGGHNSYAD
jgi:hypothetical protein